jgi:hypothetical protein
MNKQQKTIALASAATAAGVIYFSRPKVKSDFSGDFGVVDGITVDPRSAPVESAEQEGHEREIQDLSGTWHEIGTLAAMNAAYDIAVKYSDLLARMTRLMERSLSPSQMSRLHEGYLSRGRYPYETVCTPDQQDMIRVMVSCAVSYGVALRMVSRMYLSAGQRSTRYTPSKWDRRGVSLRVLQLGSFLNPLALHLDTGRIMPNTWEIQTASGWEAAGIMIEQQWMEAYGINWQSIPGSSDIASDFRTAEASLEDASIVPRYPMQGNQTMGVSPVTIAIAIAIVVVGVGAAYGIYRTLSAVSVWISADAGFKEAQINAYERAMECATNTDLPEEERAECRSLAAEINEQAQSYDSGWSGITTLLVLGGVGAGGYILYKKYGKKYLTKRK